MSFPSISKYDWTEFQKLGNIEIANEGKIYNNKDEEAFKSGIIFSNT